MTLIIKERFNQELNEILEFIARDSLNMAIKFHNDIYENISKIPFMPYAYPKNQIADKKTSEI